MKKLSFIFAVILIFILQLGCDSINNSIDIYDHLARDSSPDEIQSLILDNGKPSAEFIINPYSILESSISRDTLYFKLQYSGGCNEHDFELTANNYFMESFPVQAALVLSHNGHNDACDAIITKELFFDLSPIQNEYRASYGNSIDPIILNILIDSQSNDRLHVTYSPSAVYKFSFDNAEDANGWQGITYEMFVDDTSPHTEGKSLYIGGGCPQPAASKRIIINESGTYSISCWGKTNHNGGSVVLKNSGSEIYINIASMDWAYYQSSETIECYAGETLSLEFWVGGIVYDDLFCDELEIRKL